MADLSKVVASQAVEITDGVSQTAVILTSAPVGTESALVVRTIPSGTQTITGSITVTPVATQTVAGTVTVVPSGTQNIIGTVTSSITGSLPAGINNIGVVGSVTFISVSNSTTTNLAANAVFTGAWEDVTSFGMVSVIAFSDQPSASNGLVFQWSTTSITVDDTETFSVPAANGYTFSLPPEARYFRLTYTNGVTAQVTFRVQSIYKVNSEIMTLGRSRQSNPLSQVSDGQRVGLMTDGIGRLVTAPMHVRQMTVRLSTTISTTTETIILSSVASVYQDITLMVITNTSATATRIDIRDSTGGAIVYSVNLAAFGGAVIPFQPPLTQTSLNQNWTATLGTAVTDVRVLVTAVKNV